MTETRISYATILRRVADHELFRNTQVLNGVWLVSDPHDAAALRALAEKLEGLDALVGVASLRDFNVALTESGAYAMLDGKGEECRQIVAALIAGFTASPAAEERK